MKKIVTVLQCNISVYIESINALSKTRVYRSLDAIRAFSVSDNIISAYHM